jgi:monofunctional biosynthetic peptidoglycan transglycosylase
MNVLAALRRGIIRLIWLAIGLFLLIQLWFAGWLLWWKWTPPQETSFMSIRLAELRQKKPDAQLQYRWVDYNRISPNLKRALIAAEDARFVEHEGFDWNGIQYAMEKNLRRGRISAGGSTISQQLAKNLFLSPSRSFWRKGEEAILTVMLEALWSKERIFEVYLNVIEWGNGVFGAEAAAWHYYRHSAATLSSGEAAKLAAMVPNPRFYDKNRYAPGLRRKTEIILQRMRYSALPQQGNAQAAQKP